MATLRVESRSVACHCLTLARFVLGPVISDECETLAGEAFGDRRGRCEYRLTHQIPAKRARGHRPTEQIASGHCPREIFTRDPRLSGQRYVDSKIGPAVCRDEKVAEEGVPLARDAGRYSPVSERTVRGQGERPLSAAPLVENECFSLNPASLAVLQCQSDFCAGRQQLHSARRVAAKNHLEMNFLAEFVDAAIGEQFPAKKILRFGDVVIDSERPGLDAFVPVAPDVCEIAVFFCRDDEQEAPRLVPRVVFFLVGVGRRELLFFPVRFGQLKPQFVLRSHRDAIAVGAAPPEDLVVLRADRDVGTRDWPALVESGDEDEDVFRAVLHAYAEVGDLDDGGTGFARVPRRMTAGDPFAVLDCRPQKSVSRRRKRAGDVETVRLNLVGRRGQFSCCRSASWSFAESVLLEPHDGGHEVGFRERFDPLAHRAHVARIERELRSSARFPYSVPVAEAGEGAAVPMLDVTDPAVAESLAIDGFEIRFHVDTNRACRDDLIPEVFESEPAESVVIVRGVFRSGGSRQRLRRRAGGHVCGGDLFARLVDVQLRAKRERVV